MKETVAHINATICMCLYNTFILGDLIDNTNLLQLKKKKKKQFNFWKNQYLNIYLFHMFGKNILFYE